MDILTQGLLGAAMAQSVARQQEVRLASAIGLIAGISADADMLIRSSDDPLLTIEFHRHFSHSLFFVPFGALIVSLLLWFAFRKQMPFIRLYLYSFMGYALSGVLDAMTSYGTHLFWPWSDHRVALNIISVVDPIFTLILLVSVGVSLKYRAVRPACVGLLLAASYLCLGWIQLQRAEAQADALILERGHIKERLLVKPTLGNLLLRRSIYQHEGRLYVDAIRVGLMSPPRIYRGTSIKQFMMEQDLPALPASSPLVTDIVRFSHFSAGWLGIDHQKSNVLVDVRYSNLPHQVDPLWSIQIEPDQPGQHANFVVSRDASKETREQFLAMLLGTP